MRVEVVRCAPPVNESERLAADQLKTRLISQLGDGTWWLFTNLLFSATPERQPDEIDIVALGPPGIRLIEVKHWTGSWVRRHPGRVEDEADRVTRKAQRLGTTLRRTVASLRFVEGVFLVTESARKVRELRKLAPVRGVPFYTLPTWREALGLGAPATLSEGEVEVLAHQLKRRQPPGRAKRPQRIAGYTNLKLRSPAEERFHRVFDAVHHSRQDRVVLHLYDLSAGEDHGQPERDWKRLHELQRYGWAPRLVDSLQDLPGHHGEVQFFTAANEAAPDLRRRVADADWDSRDRVKFAAETVSGLRELWSAGSPDGELLRAAALGDKVIRVRQDQTPLFDTFVPFPSSESDIPESGGGDASAPADAGEGDVNALLAMLAGLFEGRKDRWGRGAREILERWPRTAPPKRLGNIGSALTELAERAAKPAPGNADSWAEGEEIHCDGHLYRVVAPIGVTSAIRNFQVVELDQATGRELGAHIALASADEAVGRDLRAAYARAASLPAHPGLGAVGAVAPEWRPDRFAAVLPASDGASLDEYSGVLPILAEDLGESSTEALVLRWLRGVCGALDVMHRNGVVHRNVRPGNLIVTGGDLVLSGFERVERSDATQAASGRATAQDDLRALAKSIHDVLWPEETTDPSTQVEPEADRDEFPVVAPFLDRAMGGDSGRPLDSAAEALRLLSPKEEPRDVAPEPRSRNRVPWLRQLLQSYPGSRWGNRETRGLDSEFAEKTYVPTELEVSLEQDIRKRRVRLVVLCGNAGDGKTALLQHLARRLGIGTASSAERILEGRLSNGGTVRMNFDGSAAWDGRSATELLDEFLNPFQQGPPEEDLVHLLAVNDGRLLEWIEEYESETPLTETLSEAVYGNLPAEASHIRFENLNHRSLVGKRTSDGARVETRFADRLVDALYGGENAAETWRPCRTCTAQERCEVFRAAGVFGPAPLAPDEVRAHARGRLFEALQAVHLRGETHITVRELRAALVYILFGTDDCKDYHESDRPAGSRPRYGERAFAPRSRARQGEVLKELVRFDPALESDARLDRALWKEHLARIPETDLALSHRMVLGQLRRWAYFEGDISGGGGAPLAGGANLQRFLDLASGSESAELTRRLCAGISRLQSLPDAALDRPDVVPLPINPRTPTETAFWVEKPLASFRVEPDRARVAGDAGWLHRRALLIYHYDDGREEQLPLGAELFHLLLELGGGRQLGDAGTEGAFARLSIFVQRVMQEDERRIMAWNPMREDQVFEVEAAVEREAGELRQMLRITPAGTEGDGGQEL